MLRLNGFSVCAVKAAIFCTLSSSSQMVTADGADQTLKDICRDPSITLHQRFLWEIFRGSEDSSDEKSCHTIKANSIQYTTLDHNYLAATENDARYRSLLKNHKQTHDPLSAITSNTASPLTEIFPTIDGAETGPALETLDGFHSTSE